MDDDRACIHAQVDKMDGAAGNLGPVVQGLFPALHAGKGRKQGRVYVQYPARKGVEQALLDHPHEACQGDNVGLMLFECLDIVLLSLAFDVTEPGMHTIHVWMREDGSAFDKLVITLDRAMKAPNGDGPAESRKE